LSKGRKVHFPLARPGGKGGKIGGREGEFGLKSVLPRRGGGGKEKGGIAFGSDQWKRGRGMRRGKLFSSLCRRKGIGEVL